jgi:hypothetical protein
VLFGQGSYQEGAHKGTPSQFNGYLDNSRTESKFGEFLTLVNQIIWMVG